MSVPERGALSAIPQYRQLAELHARQATLGEGMAADDFATPDIEAAYANALQEVNEQSAALAADPELQARILEAGTQAVKILEQVEPLRGILSADAIAEMETGARQDASSVADYYRRYGADTEMARELLASLAQVGNLAISHTPDRTVPPAAAPAAAPVVPPSPSPEAAPRPKTPIALVFDAQEVRIGKRGQATPYSGRTREDQRDYSGVRKSMLMRLATNPDQTYSSTELWDAVHADETPFDGRAMEVIHKWLRGLTYRRDPIIAYHGKRNGQRMGISPSYEIEVVDRTMEAEEQAPDAGQNPEEAEQMLGGVRLSSLYIMAQRLTSNNYVLEGYGMQTIDPQLLEDLSVYRPDLSHLRDQDEAALLTYRDECVSEIQAVFEDDERFAKFVEELDESENEAALHLVVYLMDLLEDSEQRNFVSRLMGAKPRKSVQLARHGGIDGMESELVDQKGAVMWPIPGRESDDSSRFAPASGSNNGGDAAEAAAGTVTEAEATVPEATDTSDDEAEPAAPPAAAVPPAKESKRPERRRSKRYHRQLEAVRSEAGDIVKKFLEHFSADTSFHIDVIGRALGMNSLRKRAVEYDKHFKIRYDEKTDGGELDVRKLVKISIYGNKRLRNFLTHNESEVDEVIGKVLSQALANHR